MNITEVGDTFNCDCGFSWKRGFSGSHDCGDGLRRQIADLKVQILANQQAQPVGFDVLADAVKEVTGGIRMEFAQDTYKGHQPVPFMNFTSLSRIVEMFRTAPPAPAEPDERHAFESFVAQQFGQAVDRRRAKNGDNEYMAWDMAMAWIVWQRRAAMLAQPVSQGGKLDSLNIRAVSALREAVRNQWLKSNEFAEKVYWHNMHSIANEIIEAMAAAPTQGENQ